MSKRLSLWILIVALLGIASAVNAQGQTPAEAVDAASAAANAALPDLGRPERWQHELLPPASDSTLGCEGAVGFALPQAVTPYRVTLFYDDVGYVVHTTADGSRAQLCDSKFPGTGSGVRGAGPDVDAAQPGTDDNDGDGILNTLDDCPYVAGKPNDVIFNGCPTNPNEGDSDADGVLNALDDCPEQPGPSVNNGCSLWTDSDGDIVPDVADLCPTQVGAFLVDGFVQGCPLDGSGVSPQTRTGDCGAAANVPTMTVRAEARIDSPAVNAFSGGLPQIVIGRNGASDWYQISGGWVSSTEVGLVGECYNIPITDGAALATAACTLTPASAFSNVRSAPNLEAPIAATIAENSVHAVLGRNFEGDWYQISGGWVSGTVIRLAGACENVAFVTPDQAAVQPGLQCPPDFEGYLPPRIQLGTATARVGEGDLPNRLRTAPSTDATIIGQAQPGRRFDAVLVGPACSAGFVWWQVEIDGIIGWTAESGSEIGNYFLEPTADGVPVAGTAPEVGVGETGAINAANARFLNRLATLPTENARAVAFSPDGSRLAIFASDRVQILNYPAATVALEFTALAAGTLPNFIGDALAFSPDSGLLAAGFADGTVQVFNFDSSPQTTQTALSNGHTDLVSDVAFSPDGRLLATVSGRLPDASDMTMKIWDITQMDIASGQTPILHNFAFPVPPKRLAFSADGGLLAVTADTALWVYTMPAGELAFSKAINADEGFAFVEGVPAQFPTGGTFVYGSGGAANIIIIGGDVDGEFISEGEQIVNGVRFSPVVSEDGNFLTAVSNMTRSAPSGREQVRLYSTLGSGSQVGGFPTIALDMAFSPDGASIVVVTFGGEVEIWGLA